MESGLTVNNRPEFCRMKRLPLIAYLKTWVRLVPLLVVTLENPIDRAGRGYRLDPLLLECLLDGRGATPFIVLGQGMMQVDDGLGEEGGRFGCRGPGSFAPLPRPLIFTHIFCASGRPGA